MITIDDREIKNLAKWLQIQDAHDKMNFERIDENSKWIRTLFAFCLILTVAVVLLSIQVLK